jgi:hypothetical protein
MPWFLVWYRYDLFAAYNYIESIDNPIYIEGANEGAIYRTTDLLYTICIFHHSYNTLQTF